MPQTAIEGAGRKFLPATARFWRYLAQPCALPPVFVPAILSPPARDPAAMAGTHSPRVINRVAALDAELAELSRQEDGVMEWNT
ncbi:hypothetical protein [Mycobacterium haemophilum]|uniref:hypothetical protein n=1 Tax=Mycobacterium haemophilum TaxID=29311 RepID=UPI000AEA4D56|nr:hypothetical protein [Mycobacterium haemophilum]